MDADTRRVVANHPCRAKTAGDAVIHCIVRHTPRSARAFRDGDLTGFGMLVG